MELNTLDKATRLQYIIKGLRKFLSTFTTAGQEILNGKILVLRRKLAKINSGKRR